MTVKPLRSIKARVIRARIRKNSAEQHHPGVADPFQQGIECSGLDGVDALAGLPEQGGRCRLVAAPFPAG
ncbi:MAG: hypothetical protein ACT4PM_07455 [Gemmatimonadales bacterium]